MMNKGRFIAGAICPQCQEQDRLVVELVAELAGGQNQRRCVACGFTDALTDTSIGGVPRGKPEKVGPDSEPPRKLNIFDPHKPRN